MHAGATRWAREEIGATRLGDVRNPRRRVAMAAGAARQPSGQESGAFDRVADREGAYDFLKNDKVDAEAVIAAMGAASASSFVLAAMGSPREARRARPEDESLEGRVAATGRAIACRRRDPTARLSGRASSRPAHLRAGDARRSPSPAVDFHGP